MTDFFRFPHTPHIAWMAPISPRDDKVLSGAQAAALLDGEVVVEEKLDGANLGFSVFSQGAVQAQNRGQYLKPPFHGQFARLGAWLAFHESRLFDALGTNLMAFGEWCAARHSVRYETLPDWWLLFDLYDRAHDSFWSTTRRDAWASEHGFAVVPRLHAGRVSVSHLRKWVEARNSRYGTGNLEGLVVRRENADWLEARAKLVRPGFTQAIDTHWRRRALEWNRLDQKPHHAVDELSP